ncbi:plasmid mobilization relaxosome protein MobC [Shewanella sp. 202IG2-18]|uniref:plasmid mobilization relaxosome protein MobC n=1 Tax=Parashewanella hymeniacidonis TaxID=2807618 RepID=UPI001960EA1B|nr:plasmid mobilization relaxosome protein MobC [Parashewanella hymeniacidonis]MBM7073680.1 plasmid mobilization relaxosome protein MobC [Parashewanella hymeniacidonis]
MVKQTVKTQLSEEDKQKWQQFCQANGMTESAMMRFMMSQVLPDIASNDEFHEAKSNKITIRLSEHEMQKLTTQAVEEGYIYRTSWATACVMANLTRIPVLTEGEIKALRESNRQLAAVGRNLNQIARVLNIDYRYSDKFTREMIQVLDAKFEKHKVMVNDLINKNCKRWELESDDE